jgi:hypothetical protein
MGAFGDISRRKALRYQQTVQFRTIQVYPKDQPVLLRQPKRALWQRGWASDDSPKAQAIGRQAFDRAVAAGAEPAVIIEGARVWIAAADAPRFLPGLPQWLAAQGWSKPPPTKRKGRRHRGDGLPRSNGRKVDLTRLALKMGGYQEDEDGKLHHPDGDEGCSFDWRASQ